MSALRNDQLVAVASLIQQQTVPIVLAGDLNSTSYSPYFEDLCSRTGLRDSRQGFGIQASWSPRLPLLEICIDHCLVPPAIHVANRRAGPHLGSDHRPIMVTLTWTGDAQQ
jgi:endonuclease/exonuclease/phosphatase (EEP) superfamily protein YafD